MSQTIISRISVEQFYEMRNSWNALLEQSITREVFLSWEWIYSWWTAFKHTHKELYILIGTNKAGELVGISPFYLEKESQYGLSTRWSLRFCSERDTSPDHLDVIVSKNNEHTFLDAVFSFLAENRKKWDIIRLDGLHQNSALVRFITETSLKQYSMVADIAVGPECPYIEIRETFEEYWKSFSGKTRNTLLRKKKKLLNEVGCIMGISSTTDQDFDRYFAKLFELHGERSSRKRIETAFTGNDVQSFHRTFSQLTRESTSAIIAYVSQGSEILALYYCLKYNNKYYYYQTGLSQNGEKRSAGVVLLSFLIQQAFEEQSFEFDFLKGNESYKYFWTNRKRNNIMISIHKKNVVNSARIWLNTFLLRPCRSYLKELLNQFKHNNFRKCSSSP